MIKPEAVPCNIKIKIRGLAHDLHNMGQPDLVVFRPSIDNWPTVKCKSLGTLLATRKKFRLHNKTGKRTMIPQVEVDLDKDM